MFDALPPHLADRMCLFLDDIRDASHLQRTCKRLRWAGLGPECKWHWWLNREQSIALCDSRLRERILKPGTAVRSLNLFQSTMSDVSLLGNVHTLGLAHANVQDVSALCNVHWLDLSGTKVTNVCALGNVYALHLRGTNVADV